MQGYDMILLNDVCNCKSHIAAKLNAQSIMQDSEQLNMNKNLSLNSNPFVGVYRINGHI